MKNAHKREDRLRSSKMERFKGGRRTCPQAHQQMEDLPMLAVRLRDYISKYARLVGTNPKRAEKSPKAKLGLCDLIHTCARSLCSTRYIHSGEGTAFFGARNIGRLLLYEILGGWRGASTVHTGECFVVSVVRYHHRHCWCVGSFVLALIQARIALGRTRTEAEVPSSPVLLVCVCPTEHDLHATSAAPNI